jgi:DNA-binding beta-propeller fold protein YncE
MRIVLLLLLLGGTASAQEWPLHFAPYSVEILKDSGLEPEDPHWMHLHRGHHSATASESVRLRVNIFRGSRSASEVLSPAASGIEIRYTVHGVPVSEWMSPASPFTLHIDNPALNALDDGFHDISVEVRGTNRDDFKPHRAFLHMTRGRAVSTLVPVINSVTGYNGDGDFGPAVVYVDSRQRRMVGHPADPRVTPWDTPPYEADLYLEQLAPGGNYVGGAQLWWEDPPHPGVPFARALDPNQSQDHRFLREGAAHQKFPFRDGPRGVGWMSAYVSGQVDSKGGFAFVETGGPLRYLKPDGEIVTVAGWRVKPGRDPVWSSKPLETIRGVMEKRGQWLDGRGEFFTPLDVAIDPQNENVWYVAGYEDHCIWRVEIEDLETNRVRVSVFAGSPAHAAGFADGTRHAARFNGPASLVFDPVSDALYVADQDNDAIRRITRDGTVTTLFGSPGMADRLRARGSSNVFDQDANRLLSRFTVDSAPDIYRPQCVRVDSNGNLVLLELGYGSIRRLDPRTGAARLLGNVHQIFGDGTADNYRGWAWLDVDRWGNSGPRDGIYWCKAVGDEIDGDTGSHFNEVYAWLPPGGGESRYVFGEHWNPYPDGWGRRAETTPPHYAWLVAVDPRGALLVGGFGTHGVSRLRVRRDGDPLPAHYHPAGHEDGRLVWASGAPWLWPGPPGSARYASRPASLQYGWNAHNYLGFADAWELRGDETDEQLLNYFEAAAPVRNDAQARALWLDFVRSNRGAPVPDCVKPAITAQPAGFGGALSVSATGALPLAYTWYAGESGDTRVPVETGSTLHAPASGRYWVRVSNRCGVALSAVGVSADDASPRRRSVRH